MKKDTICLCGGGSLGHVIAGFIAAKGGMHVNILTSQPSAWSNEMNIVDSRGNHFTGHLSMVSDNPERVIPQSNIVLLCLPGYAISETLCKIKPYVQRQYIGSVVSSTGFFFMANELLDSHTKCFGLQRVPFISRVLEYGKSAKIMGYKDELKVATKNIAADDPIFNLLESLFETPIKPLNHYLEASLTNSNPLLHTTRLYSLFHDYNAHATRYDRHCLFYEDWDDRTSDILISCDREFQAILDKLPINRAEIPTILSHYESFDATSLTQKIRSIEAFKGIKSPMLPVEDGYFIPDFKNRYFTEDFPYGLNIIKATAIQTNSPTPTIDMILEWGYKILGKDVFENSYFNSKRSIII